MPPEFRFPSQREIWAPRLFREEDYRDRTDDYMYAVGRLKEGISLQDAQHALDAITLRLAAMHPETNRDRGASLVPLPEYLVERVRPALLVLFGAVLFVLLIACANLANLMLVRNSGRRRELSTRAALGAPSGRLMRQLFTESLVLALMGAAGGTLLARWSVGAVVALAGGYLPATDDVRVDARVLGFALGMALIATVLFGLLPALRVSPARVQEWLRESGRTATSGGLRQRLRKLLVAGEVSLTLVLLAGAGLLTRSLLILLAVNPGFADQNVLFAQIFIWDRQPTPPHRAAFMEQVLERIASIARSAHRNTTENGVQHSGPTRARTRPAADSGLHCGDARLFWRGWHPATCWAPLYAAGYAGKRPGHTDQRNYGTPLLAR
jgi:putative ABC transport system permease protein